VRRPGERYNRPPRRSHNERNAIFGGASVQLIRPTTADIPFIMATERIEGYERLVGRSDGEWHRAALADASFAYFIGRLDDDAIGFAILRGWAAPEQVVHIKRLAVVRPGQGLGKAFLRAIVGAAFQETKAYRLSIGLFPENLRARRAYEGVGFQAEGVSRGSALFEGTNRDELVMSLLRPEWMAKCAPSSPLS
jgi:RimJ/RimL family protein N-acetyltransferase